MMRMARIIELAVPTALVAGLLSLVLATPAAAKIDVTAHQSRCGDRTGQNQSLVIEAFALEVPFALGNVNRKIIETRLRHDGADFFGAKRDWQQQKKH